jgi:O-antigen ligase
LSTKSITASDFDDIWGAGIAVYLVVMILSGGISNVGPPVIYLHLVLASIVACVAIARLFRMGIPTRLAIVGMWIIILTYGLILWELVPLPPSLWTILPGRDLVLRNLILLGRNPDWMPLTLTPEATRQCALDLLPGAAGFLAALTFPTRKSAYIIIAVLFCLLPSLIFAFLQYAHGNDGSYYVYENNFGVGTGLFNNRNFFAAQVYTALPFIGIAVPRTARRFQIPVVVAIMFGITIAAISLAGLAVSGSRTGIGLAMVSLVFAVILARDGFPRSRMPLSLLGTSAVVGGLLVLGQASMMGIMRFGEPGLGVGIRSEIWSTSWIALHQHFIFGSGLGSFSSVYQLVETPAVLKTAYINHVHNDWFELAIETGLLGISLMLVFVLWYLYAVYCAWRYGNGKWTAEIQRVATIVLLLLMVHSADDFALRTPALLTLFGICCGLACIRPITRSYESATQLHRRGWHDNRPKAERTGHFGHLPNSVDVLQ